MSNFVIHRNHLIIPADNRVTTMMPHAKRMQHNGQEFVIVPHQLDETKVLRNLGLNVPPPILSQYAWCGGSPFDAQRITAAHITTHPFCFVLNAMGTGKTRAALFAYDFMRSLGVVNRLLVTAPLSTIRQTWQREVTMHFPHLTTRVLHKNGWSGDRRKLELDDPADIYIINHDGVKVIFDALFARKDIDMMVLDELTTYKSTQSDMWKVTNKLARRMSRIVGMTGSPIPKDPTDAYGQIKIVDPSRAGRSFSDFRDRVMRKITTFKYIPKADAVDTVHKLMQPSVRFTRDECYDLPPCQYVEVPVTLTPEQSKLFKQVAQECAAEVASGTIKAVNEADRLNKLVQIATGFAYDTQRNTVHFDVTPRLDALMELIEESASKVIVFTPYKASLKMLADAVAKRYTFGVISGDVSPGERELVFTAFRNSPDPHVIVAHPECMSHGLTLTEASTIVWYGPPPSLEIYEQANARITRPGQRHSQLIAKLSATPVERAIYARYDNRAKTQGLLLELFAGQDPLGDLS